MLKSYEAIYENGQVMWLRDQPTVRSAQLIVTVLEDSDSSVYSEAQVQDISRRRFPPASIEGKGKTLGDIVSPIVDEEDWECLK